MDKSQLKSIELSGSDIKSLLAGEMIKITAPVLTEEQHLLGYGYDPMICLLYTSPSPRDRTRSRMPSSA